MLQHYRGIYAEVFRFHERHLAPQTPEEWTEVFTDLRTLQERIGISPFFCDLLTAVVREMQRTGETMTET